MNVQIILSEHVSFSRQNSYKPISQAIQNVLLKHARTCLKDAGLLLNPKKSWITTIECHNSSRKPIDRFYTVTFEHEGGGGICVPDIEMIITPTRIDSWASPRLL